VRCISIELAPKTVSGNTTANSQRKGDANNWSGYSKTMRTKACVDVGNKQLSRMNAKNEMGRNVQQ